MSEQHEYKIRLSADLCKAVPQIGSALQPVADMLSTHGGGRFEIRGGLVSATITASRILTRKERALVKRVILESFNERFPSFAFEVQSMRRQSVSLACKSNSN